MGQLGIGAMIGYLGGNEETVKAIQESLNQKIVKVELIEDKLLLYFKTHKLSIFDDGQSCCESRYMNTDDDLTYFTNTIFKNIEIKPADSIEDEWGEHEVQFLEITTGKGSFVMQTHNEHNGYYGGFWVVAKKENL